uniref:DM2 domain-containing protein n=1 Tax=viral metagenome TaxID=1070528 RepID=A0A6C0KRL7_9ZZZZ
MSIKDEILFDSDILKLSSIFEEFNNIYDSLTLFKMQISSLQQKVKCVEKNVKKELKNLTNNVKKNKVQNKRAPSGFAKPSKVTKELCAFMEKPEGSEIARTEVTKFLVKYIKTNNLFEQDNIDNKNNKIVPDEKLKNLLGIDDFEISNLNYFNIQKYMNKHFYSNKQLIN